MKKRIGWSIALVAVVGVIWPMGFAVGYTVKERQICQKVKGNTPLFRYTAGGIMRGEKAQGTLRSSLYVDGLKKGMLFSLKQCHESAS